MGLQLPWPEYQELVRSFRAQKWTDALASDDLNKAVYRVTAGQVCHHADTGYIGMSSALSGTGGPLYSYICWHVICFIHWRASIRGSSGVTLWYSGCVHYLDSGWCGIAAIPGTSRCIRRNDQVSEAEMSLMTCQH